MTCHAAGARPVAECLLAVQSSAGNRAVTALVARQPVKQAPPVHGTVKFGSIPVPAK